MTDWTTARVQDRLELAADVFAQLPAVKPTGYFNAWPEYVHSFAGHVGQEPQMKRPRPTPRMALRRNQSNRNTTMTLAFAPERIKQWPLAKLQPCAKNAKVHGARPGRQHGVQSEIRGRLPAARREARSVTPRAGSVCGPGREAGRRRRTPSRC